MTAILRDMSLKAVCESINQINLEALEGYQTHFDHSVIFCNNKGFNLSSATVATETDSDLQPSEIKDTSRTTTRLQVDHELKVQIQKQMQSVSSVKEG